MGPTTVKNVTHARGHAKRPFNCNQGAPDGEELDQGNLALWFLRVRAGEPEDSGADRRHEPEPEEDASEWSRASGLGKLVADQQLARMACVATAAASRRETKAGISELPHDVARRLEPGFGYSQPGAYPIPK